MKRTTTFLKKQVKTGLCLLSLTLATEWHYWLNSVNWQHLLPRQRHQQSWQPLAPSSADASSSAAATNRPSGTANRHNRRRPGTCRGPELRAGGRGLGGEGTRSGPSALGRGPGDRGPRPVRAEGPRRQGNPEAAPRVRQGRRHGRRWVCYCRLCPFLRGACREWAGEWGEGRARWPGRLTEAARRSGSRQAAGKGATPPSVAAGRRATLAVLS